MVERAIGVALQEAESSGVSGSNVRPAALLHPGCSSGYCCFYCRILGYGTRPRMLRCMPSLSSAFVD